MNVAARIAALLVLALACLLGGGLVGFDLGDTSATGRHARQAEAQRQQAARLDAAARLDGTRRVAALQQQVEAAREYRNTLEKRLSHAPILVPAATPAAPSIHAARGAEPLLAMPAPARTQPTEAAAGAGADCPAPVAADRLSLGAVSLWNSALAGADMPAGACGPADTASATCAADAGIGIADAWLNHIANAQSCAAVRAQLGALIDHIHRWQQPADAATLADGEPRP